ncbi:MAG: nucleotidyltransferase domain-containing protein [Bacteroidales bacterium]|nr:nucleotidyltransferase domain-containing protein [Bacteroidales bacterium]
MNLINDNIEKIRALCTKYKVESMSVFGSLLTNKFNDSSDVDLLVSFLPHNVDSFDYVSNYFGLQEELESLLQRDIDLVEEKGLRNRIFIEEVNKTKKTIYG